MTQEEMSRSFEEEGTSILYPEKFWESVRIAQDRILKEAIREGKI